MSIKRSIKSHIRDLTILVPALNEEGNLSLTIKRLQEALAITIEDYEIIIVNDGSTDSTAEIANEIAGEDERIKVVHHVKPKGLGFAYSEGIEKAAKSNFVYIPGDNTWPFRSYVELFGNMGKAELITSHSSNSNVRPFTRRLISKWYTNTINFLYGHDLKYYNGLTIYPISFLKNNIPETSGFGFQAELLLKALHSDYSYLELPLPIDERTAGGSKAVTVRNIISVAKTLIRTFIQLKILSNYRLQDLKENKISSLFIDEKKFIVISGCSSGIGRELALALCSEGHLVYGFGRNQEGLAKTGKGIENFFYKVCDGTNEDQVINLLKEIELKWGKIDALINCAGAFGAIGPIEQTNSNEWLGTIKTNLFGPYLLIKYSIPLLKNSKSPSIINFSGGGAFSPFPNYSAYASSKAALIRLTETLAIELAPEGIRVNAIAPGNIATNAHQATIKAGVELAGEANYLRAKNTLANGGAPMNIAISCIKEILSSKLDGLTGKTISANFDPWSTKDFLNHIEEISKSDLFCMRRINIINLPKGRLRKVLSEAWASFGTLR